MYLLWALFRVIWMTLKLSDCIAFQEAFAVYPVPHAVG
jgi:hypothetical protein